jgi:hypothetical protein
VSYLGGHRPRWCTDDTPDDMHLHRPKGTTPRTAGTTDHHHVANLTDPFPRHAGITAGTSFKQGRPFGLWDAAGSEKFVQQSTAPSVHPPHHPIRQRPSAQVMGLDGRAKPVSKPRKRGSGIKEHGRVEKVQRRRRSPGGRARGGGLDPATACLHRQ